MQQDLQPFLSVMLSLLLVEDNADVRATMAAMLRRLSYDVTAVDSADTALARVQSAPVDIILTDYNLPGTDGVALLLRARQLLPDVVALVASGVGQQGEWEHVDGWMVKPLSLADLQRGLQSALAERSPKAGDA